MFLTIADIHLLRSLRLGYIRINYRLTVIFISARWKTSTLLSAM